MRKSIMFLTAVLAALATWVAVPASPAQAKPGSVYLFPGETLLPTQYLYNPSGNGFKLVMQLDGNLVLYKNTKTKAVACAASRTTRYPGSHAWMSPNGYFAVYEPHGGVVWTTRPHTDKNDRLDQAYVQLDAYGNSSVQASNHPDFRFWHC